MESALPYTADQQHEQRRCQVLARDQLGGAGLMKCFRAAAGMARKSTKLIQEVTGGILSVYNNLGIMFKGHCTKKSAYMF